MGERTPDVVDGDLGKTLEALSALIAGRRSYSPHESYTALLLSSGEDKCLSKLMEEAGEVALACKDNDHDHIRYEMADVLYHLLVVAERYHISLAEIAGELNARHH